MPLQEDCLSLPDDASSIWSDPSLAPLKTWFPSAMFLLQEQQRQQQPDFTARQKQANEKDNFLDRLALLFSPTKVPKHTPKNVTATALVQHRSEDFWRIYIAKNNGYSDADLGCAKWISEWFDCKSSNRAKEDEHWHSLLEYWKPRTTHYLKKRVLEPANWSRIQNSKESIRDFFQQIDEHFRMDDFELEWKQISKLFATKDDKNNKDRWMQFYNFWNRTTKQQYPDQRSPESQKHAPESQEERLAIEYRAVVYYFEMLGLPMSIWKALERFRDIIGQDLVTIHLIKKPFDDKLDKSAIRNRLELWKEQDGLDTSTALARLGPPDPKQAIYFHCELQILTLFHRLENDSSLIKHKFIGCSKLSCHLCWEILKERCMKTRGTHGKVSANCAFPFPKELETMVKTFCDLHSKWESFFKAHKHGKFPVWPNQIDTEPARTELMQVDKETVKATFDSMKVHGFAQSQYPYKIVKEFKPGKGTFGTVFAAYCGEDKINLYALKQIVISDSDKLDLVKQEIDILRGLQHINILVLRTAFYDQSEPRNVFLVTSPWAPLTLNSFFHKVLNGDPPTWYHPDTAGLPGLDPWRMFIKQCLEGLAYLHSNNIIHKDLKPHNILLQNLGATNSPANIRPIIADFGISKHWIPGGKTEHRGTPEFQAPEQLPPNNAPATQYSDLWSFGCCVALISVLLFRGKFGLERL